MTDKKRFEYHEGKEELSYRLIPNDYAQKTSQHRSIKMTPEAVIAYMQKHHPKERLRVIPKYEYRFILRPHEVKYLKERLKENKRLYEETKTIRIR